MSEKLNNFIGENKEDLIAEFIDKLNFQWQEFCKMKFRESKE